MPFMLTLTPVITKMVSCLLFTTLHVALIDTLPSFIAWFVCPHHLKGVYFVYEHI